MDYIAFLGRIAPLCFEEFRVVLNRFDKHGSVADLQERVLFSTDISEEQLSLFFFSLGGTTKIGRVIAKIEKGNTEEISETIAKIVKEDEKIPFTFTSHASSIELSNHDIKKFLAKQGIQSRYLETPSSGANAAQLLHKHVLDFSAVELEEKVLLVQTILFQDIEDWGNRDYEKPYRDAKRGMLPPKLARIMVNLAIGERNPFELRIYDPFCGSGTVLMEGMKLGCEVAGSDISQEAVQGTAKNLQWMAENEESIRPYSLFVADASQVSLNNLQKNVDCVVTEPFLGKPNIQPRDVGNVLKGLEKLYIGAVKKWKTILNKNGTVVMIFPKIVFGQRENTLHALVDRLEDLGYTRENGPFVYSRPQTVVQREIYVFRNKGK